MWDKPGTITQRAERQLEPRGWRGAGSFSQMLCPVKWSPCQPAPAAEPGPGCESFLLSGYC